VKLPADYSNLASDLASFAKNMSSIMDDSKTDLFVKAGPEGIRFLCKLLNGEVLALSMVITPELAVVFRSLETDRQRTANELTVDSYTRDIANDKWLLTGEPFIFDTDGNLVNGGHRCGSVIEAGKAIRSIVVFGVAEEAALVMDSGRARTRANMLTFHGEHLAHDLGTLVPRLISWESGYFVNPARAVKLSNSEILAYLEEHPNLRDQASGARTRANGIPGSLRSAVLQAEVLILRAGAGAKRIDEANQFLDELETGANLIAGSSVLLARNKISAGIAPRRGSWGDARRSKLNLEEQLATIITAWNRRKEEVKVLKLPGLLTDDSFPQPDGYYVMPHGQRGLRGSKN
jgi:hypothetical protein